MMLTEGQINKLLDALKKDTNNLGKTKVICTVCLNVTKGNEKSSCYYCNKFNTRN